MANRSRQLEKNREKVVQDRLQLLLTRLLQDEDNKYCIDCDSKGPRWASWNIGIFLCIRCAGIHRNLGVHISKVKSVNLDSWTPQQVASMQVMGNSKGRAVYEAGLPEDHRRPQSDAALETFIRAKYEKKKYVAREWTPTKPPDLPFGWAELVEAEKQKKDIRGIVLPSRAVGLPPPEKILDTKDEVPAKTKETEAVSQKKCDVQNSASEDLLGLVTNGTDVKTSAPPPPSALLSSQMDLLCLGGSPQADVVGEGKEADFSDFIAASSGPAPAEAPAPAATAGNDIGGIDFGGTFPSSTAATAGPGASQMSKDSIMALFNKPQSQSPQILAGANPPRPAMPPNFGGFNQQQQQLNLMNPHAQLGQFAAPAQTAIPPVASPSNPFSMNAAQTNLSFGAADASKSSSWGFAQ